MGRICVYDGGAISAAEIRFRQDIWRSAPPPAIEEAEVHRRRFGPVLVTAFGSLPDTSLVNLVQGTAEADAVDAGNLAAAIEWLRLREVDYLVSVVADRPGTERAEAWLASRGYERDAIARRFMHRGLEAAAVEADTGSSPHEIHELEPIETEGMSHIFGDALGLPNLATILLMGLPAQKGWHCYRANIDGQEVACGSMLILDNVALLGLDATIPDLRGKGCQSALLKKRLLEATKAGCDTIVTEVCQDHPGSQAATRNLERLGFEEIPPKFTWRRPSGLG